MILVYLRHRDTGRPLVVDGDQVLLKNSDAIPADAWLVEKATNVNSTHIMLGDHVRLRAPNNKILWVSLSEDGLPAVLFDEEPPNYQPLGGHWRSDLKIVSTRRDVGMIRADDWIGFEVTRRRRRYLRWVENPRRPGFSTRTRDTGGSLLLLLRRTGAVVPFQVEPLGMLLTLRTRDHRHFTAGTDGVVVAGRTSAHSPIELLNISRPITGNLGHGDHIKLRFPNGRWLRADGERLRADQRRMREAVVMIVKKQRGTGVVGDREEVRVTALDGRPLIVRRDGHVYFAMPESRDSQTLVVELTRDLRLRWNGRAEFLDNYTTSEHAVEAGYTNVRSEGRIFWGPQPGAVPLRQFHSAERHDHFVTGTQRGQRYAYGAGYQFVRIEGWCPVASSEGTTPLKSYWNPARRDNFTTGTHAGERSATGADYRFMRIEGHVFPSPRQGLATDFGVAPETLVSRLQQGNLWAILTRRSLTVDRLLGRRRPRSPRPSRRRDAEKRALVLSGGGAKGAFQAGAVQRLWRDFRPDLICGVSVGAINGAKLAEGDDGAATRLVNIWRQAYPPTGAYRVSRDNYYLDMALDGVERAITGGVEKGILRALLAFPTAGWSYLQSNLQTGGVPVSDMTRKIMTVLAQIHAFSSMAPLRRMIQAELVPEALQIELRIGLTEMTSGQFYTVSGPLPHWRHGPLREFGILEPEPDHQLGDDWATSPPHAADGHVMRLRDAVYASSAQPVFFEPLLASSSNQAPDNAILVDGDRRYARIEAYLPPTVERILRDGRLSALSLFELQREAVGDDAGVKHFFDGGLRDTTPIRTAIRLGARDILIISGDRSARAQWAYAAPGSGGEVFDLVPALQYLLGLLNIWYNDVSRNDLSLAIAHNEFLGWLYRAFSAIDDENKRKELVEEFNRYWAERGPVLRKTLGSTSWLGGDQSFWSFPSSRGRQADHVGNRYGVPFHDEACRIRLVAPDRDIIGALDFANGAQIEEALALGSEAAESPVELSFPVREEQIRVE